MATARPEVGASYRLGIRTGGGVRPMEYRIVQLEPSRRVVLSGRGSGVEAVDDIRFETRDGGTHIDYVADIRLTGLRRLVAPVRRRHVRPHRARCP